MGSRSHRQGDRRLKVSNEQFARAVDLVFARESQFATDKDAFAYRLKTASEAATQSADAARQHVAKACRELYLSDGLLQTRGNATAACGIKSAIAELYEALKHLPNV